MNNQLRTYLKNNFDFSALKKSGFYSDDVKSTDYEKQAERICHRFGLKNIYDYSLSKPITFIHPIGVATGTIKNTFGNDILEVMFNE